MATPPGSLHGLTLASIIHSTSGRKQKPPIIKRISGAAEARKPLVAEDIHSGAHKLVYVVAVRDRIVAAVGWGKMVAEIGHIAAVEADIPAAAGTVLGVGSLEADPGEHHSFVVAAAAADHSMVAGGGPGRIGYLLGMRPGCEQSVLGAADRSLAHPGYRMKSRWRPSTFSIPETRQ